MKNRVKGTGRFVIAMLGVIVLMASWSSLAAGAPKRVESPSRFRFNDEPRVASASGELWLETMASAPRQPWVIEVMKYDSDGWTRLPLIRDFAVAAVPTQFTVRESEDGGPSVPCFGDSGQEGGKLFGRIRCFEEGEWTEKQMDPALEGMKLVGLNAGGPAFTALFTNWTNPRMSEFKRRPRIALAQITGDRVVPLGPPLTVNRQFRAALGQSTDDAEPVTADVLIQVWEGKARGKRYLATLDDGRWTKSPALPKQVIGNRSSGPVRTAEGVFAGAPSRRSNSLRHLVYRYTPVGWSRIKGDPIDPDRVYSNGELFPVGDDVWMSNGAQGTFGGEQGFNYEYGTRIDEATNRFDQWHLLTKSRYGASMARGVAEYAGYPVFLYGDSRYRTDKAALDFSLVKADPFAGDQ